MRIAIVSREYPPDTLWGGESIVYYNLARELAKRGHEVHVICQAVGKPLDLIEETVFIHRVGTNAKRYSAIARINYNFYAWRKLIEVIKKYGIEIVQTSYWSAEGFPYCLRKQTPLVIQSTSSLYDSIKTRNYSGKRAYLKLKILSCITDFTIRRADRVIADSDTNYSQVTERIRIHPGKVDKIIFGIDTQKFKYVSSDIRVDLDLPNDASLILFVGRLEARKGIHIFSQAIPDIWRIIPNSNFIFLGRDTNSAPGGGSFKKYLSTKIKCDNGVSKLTFIDSLPEEQLVSLYSACDLFVFPSLQESFGLPVIEAMACGKPVVATCTGIALELKPLALKGLEVVPIGDAGRLSEAVVRMLSLTEEDKIQIAKENRNVVEGRFSLHVWVDKMIEVYQKIGKTKI